MTLLINEEFSNEHELIIPNWFPQNKFIGIKDLNHKVVGVSDYTASLWGVKTIDIQKNPCHYSELPCNIRLIADTLKSEDKQSVHRTVRTLCRLGFANNSTKLMMSEKYPLKRNGKVYGYLCMSKDLTNLPFINLHAVLALTVKHTI